MKLLERLERLEAARLSRFPWQAVCATCAAEGLTTTPYRHCEAPRCSDLHVRLTPEHVNAEREAWEGALRFAGKNVAEEDAKVEAELRSSRNAWDAEKRRLLGE